MIAVALAVALAVAVRWFRRADREYHDWEDSAHDHDHR